MFSLTITGNTPAELLDNLKKMVEAQSANPTQTVPAPSNPIPPAAETPAPYTAPTPAPVPVSIPTAQPAPVVATAPAVPVQSNSVSPGATTVSPLNPIPTAPAPTYTLEQLSRAGAALASAGKMEEARALLARFGVKSVYELPTEHYGAFATELRLLGATV